MTSNDKEIQILYNKINDLYIILLMMMNMKQK